ncbi:MAG TPA: MDR family MFS transporter [Stellaceae bacterium]|nr:MDR family MFS transporter [Stellaceae bacterium]
MDQTVAQQSRPAVIVPHRTIVFVAALIATFIPAVESSIVATAMPTIVGSLGGFHLFSWVFAVPLLTMAVTIPLYGRLADIYGRKRVFFFGTTLFLVGTTLCGFARSVEVLICFRAIQGLGSGAIQPIAMTIVGDIYTPAERARVQGWTSAVFGLAAVVGPALGAYLVQHVHWSVVFWVNLPIGCLAITMFALYLPEPPERRQHRIDYLGGVLLIVGVGSLMLALVQAKSLGTGVAGLLGLGVAALAALYWHERRAPEPMLPLEMWRRRVVLLCNIAGFGASATMMAVSALLPTYVQGVMGKSPAVAGMIISAQSVSWMFAAFAAGRLMIRTSYRLTAVVGGVSLMVGALMLASVEPESSWLWPAAAGFGMGIGMGFCNTTFLVAIQANVGFHERGIGTSSQMFMRMIGMSVGAAAYGAIINFGVDRLLPGSGGLVNRMLEPTTRASLGADTLAKLADAVGLAAHDAFLLALVLAAITLAATVSLPARLSPVRAAFKRQPAE